MSLIRRHNERDTVSTLLTEFSDNEPLDVYRFFPELTEETNWIPSANITENEEEYTVALSAPGMNKEDFDIIVDEGVLTISAESGSEEESSDDNFIRQEFDYTGFSRSFTLPEDAGEKGTATYVDGILKVRIAKQPRLPLVE